VISLGIKWSEHEADRSPQSSAEVKNGGAIPPLLHMSSWRSASLVKQRENVTFLIYY
jgi:hypothetical protein